MSLERSTAVPALIGDPSDFLLITGLGNPSTEVARINGDAPNFFPVDGAMGGAVPVGLGLALAQPSRLVLVVTGDGELLMQLGALATVSACNPENLAILCVDNGEYALTGHQRSHTGLGVDLEKVAASVGLQRTARVTQERHIPGAQQLLRDRGAARFVLLKVDSTAVAMMRFNRDAPTVRSRFRSALLG